MFRHHRKPDDYHRRVPQPRVITRRAHAKLNLILRVGPPEPPGSARAGWHPIASWMHAIDLHDDVTALPLAPGQPAQYTVEWTAGAPRPTPIDWPLDHDLAVRAHRLLEARTGRPLPVSLTITKRIPAGGGLGGGSSDAAATLLAVSGLFELNIPVATLAHWSASLGSDVAFFLDHDASPHALMPSASCLSSSPQPVSDQPPRAAFVGGFGDEVIRTPSASSALILIFPDFGCPTPAVYAAFDSLHRAPLDPSAILAAARAARVTPDLLANDLLPAAALVEPRLRPTLARAAAALARPIHMSGSGSTLFALGPPPATLPDIEGCTLLPGRLV